MVRVHQNCTIEERLNFLRIMEEIFHIGPDEGDQVTTLHSTTYLRRTTVLIRRKYHDLHRTKVPTGDLECPDNVVVVVVPKLMILYTMKEH